MSYTVVGSSDTARLLFEYVKIESQLLWTDTTNGSKQTGLQYAIGEDPSFSSVGRLKESRLEKEYNVLNPVFKDTIFEELINQYSMVRTRLLWAGAKTCYSIHHDASQRLHFPIITNNQCMFLFPDVPELFHLPTGSAYLVDTRKNHSFCNFSSMPRLHLVGCIE